MTRRHKNKSPGKSLRSLYLWHRWIGLTSAAFVVILSLTGLALNHTESLSLDSRFVHAPAVLDWYGIQAPDEVTVYAAGDVNVAAIGRQVYVDEAHLPALEPPLAGAVRSGEFVIVALADALLLLTADGEPVERMGAEAGVPAGIVAIGITGDGRPVIRTGSGDYLADRDITRWEKTAGVSAAWSRPVSPGDELVATLQQRYRGSGLPVERVMLDLHSGRILGAWGVYLMDAAAIVFLLLAVSGLVLWGKRRASARAHRRRLRRHGPSTRPAETSGTQQDDQSQQ